VPDEAEPGGDKDMPMVPLDADAEIIHRWSEAKDPKFVPKWAVGLKYSKDWRKWTQRKFDAVTVHELLHVVFHDQKIAVESIYDNLSHDAKVMLQRRFQHETEQAVEHLAQRIVDIEHRQTR
jgi:hypothetical protein